MKQILLIIVITNIFTKDLYSIIANLYITLAVYCTYNPYDLKVFAAALLLMSCYLNMLGMNI